MSKKVNLIRFINNKKIISFLSLFFLLFIAFWSISVTINQPRLHLANKSITVDTNTFATVIYKNDAASPIIKISPLTDYYYKKDYRNHVMTKVIPENQQISWKQFVVFLEGMVLGRSQFIWTPIGVNEYEAINTEYTVSLKENRSVSVIRRFFHNDVTAIGQAITFCDECYLGDTKKRLYSNRVPDSVMIDIANKLQYLPVIVEHRLPSDITELQIIDRFGAVQATIPVSSSDEVYYEDHWHLVEIKSPVIPKEQIVLQEIEL